jgi:SAM-dependent methyltransferase
MHDPDPRADILHRPPELARVFDRIPNDYEARPAYPRQVFELLSERGALRHGSLVLEVGAGSGQATLPMLALGAQVIAVEPGVGLARRLIERTEGQRIEVIMSTFEDASLSEASFDLVAAATSFHWVDPAVGATKCARVVRDRGFLALWWTLWHDPERPDPFHDALRPILQVKAPHLLRQEATPGAYVRDLAARAAHIEATGAFGPMSHETLNWEAEHDPVSLRRLFATFAPWLALSEPLRSELLGDVERLARDDFAGSVRRPYQTVLFLSQRIPR